MNDYVTFLGRRPVDASLRRIALCWAASIACSLVCGLAVGSVAVLVLR